MTEVIITSPETGPTAPVVVAPVTAPVVDPDALPSDAVVAGEKPPETAEFVMPEKFAGKSAEEIAKSYMELEKARGTPVTEKAAPVAGTDPKIALTPEQSAAVDVVTQAGLKYDDLTTEFTEKGELKAEHYDALAKKGIPKGMVDGYIKGQIALGKEAAAVTTTAAHTAAGGETQYAAMVEWAAKGGLEKPAIVAFNKAIDSGDPATISMAVQGVLAAQAKAGGSEPSNVEAGGKGAGTSVYTSTAEVMKDMGDKRYATNEVFRKRVEAKVARSNVL